jgi:NADH pyrophosphatase NudC (nudix superfamily)
MKRTERPTSLEEHSQAVVQAMRTWRTAHPQATLAEIERAVDEQVSQLRASLIEEMAQASPLERAEAGQVGRTCPQCGERLQARGKRTRRLQTQGGQQVSLTRQYQSCPACGYSFFPPG